MLWMHKCQRQPLSKLQTLNTKIVISSLRRHLLASIPVTCQRWIRQATIILLPVLSTARPAQAMHIHKAEYSSVESKAISGTLAHFSNCWEVWCCRPRYRKQPDNQQDLPPCLEQSSIPFCWLIPNGRPWFLRTLSRHYVPRRRNVKFLFVRSVLSNRNQQLNVLLRIRQPTSIE